MLVASRIQDPPEKVGFADDHWLKVEGGRAVAEVVGDVVDLAIALRNVGNGLAVLDRWDFYGERVTGDERRSPESFHRLTRDLYVPAGELGFWQGTFRDADDPGYAEALAAIAERGPMTIDLLYGDHEGGQHMVSRFALRPLDDGGWLAAVGRHWNLDRADPR